MTAETDLLPLGDGMEFLPPSCQALIRDYARANVEALRAAACGDACAHIAIERDMLQARAERLAEALLGIEKELGSELVVVSGGRVYLPERAFRKALHDGRAALEQEAGRG